MRAQGKEGLFRAVAGRRQAVGASADPDREGREGEAMEDVGGQRILGLAEKQGRSRVHKPRVAEGGSGSGSGPPSFTGMVPFHLFLVSSSRTACPCLLAIVRVRSRASYHIKRRAI